VKLWAAVKSIFVLLAVLLLNSFSFAAHTSAQSTMSHEMNGMSHRSSDAGSCATLCRTAIINKEEATTDYDECEDDDEPVAPFFVQDQTLRTDEKSVSQMLYAAAIKPPPKIPMYILHGVFRV
jgi:hypothetical protein